MCIFQKDLIVLNQIIGVMSVDALASSHPLSSKEEDVLTPEHISELFDSITYSKVWLNWNFKTPRDMMSTSAKQKRMNKTVPFLPRVTLIKDSLGTTNLKY